MKLFLNPTTDKLQVQSVHEFVGFTGYVPQVVINLTDSFLLIFWSFSSSIGTYIARMLSLLE
jgi:hypothetical protein